MRDPVPIEVTDDAELRRLHSLGRGLIYNDFSGRGSGDGNILHAAGCAWVVSSKVSVRKYYFSTLAEARRWLKTNRGVEGTKWKRCGTCGADSS